jgi:hypothetical protein
MPLIESCKEFHDRQGGDCAEIDGVRVYRNGATMEVESSGLGVRHEPHPDQYERAKTIAWYWEERVRRARDEFLELRDHLHSLAKSAVRDGFPRPPQSELERLKQLRAAVHRMQKKLSAARERVEATEPKGRRAAESQKRTHRALGERFLSDLGEIKL